MQYEGKKSFWFHSTRHIYFVLSLIVLLYWSPSSTFFVLLFKLEGWKKWMIYATSQRNNTHSATLGPEKFSSQARWRKCEKCRFYLDGIVFVTTTFNLYLCVDVCKLVLEVLCKKKSWEKVCLSDFSRDCFVFILIWNSLHTAVT